MKDGEFCLEMSFFYRSSKQNMWLENIILAVMELEMISSSQ